ncbi:CobQ/CobB/MinD/ParA nucleotide binding domain-containing protein [Actinopolyspora alba]|uniref:CobQ/CobB/MinD/ParA nucleotide binding domain-containing protein n=1 Tax=Actinopolyspora alba TaxID=673379 RepID=A0A1I2BYP5_9ACTN|nr:AAA family ATPase [Actinopolyspora alba]SFE61306.1 CobQ/CobB/MinD/ParA nucleotide binding domain-containing protein [Actinopolyspora alba]
MRVVPFFNHKGGVGKTTLLFNIGIALASLGKRVIFVDLDAQANLTSAAIPSTQIEKILEEEQSVYNCLLPVIHGTGSFASPSPYQIRDNAWILPGDINISEFEEICPQGWTEALAGNMRGFQVSTTIHRLIHDAGDQVNADYAFVDLGPNVGALNRITILSSDGFVVPLAPDLFSLTALPSVGKSSSRWVQEWETALDLVKKRKLQFPYDLPAGQPSPLGYISQQFAVYREAPAAAYRRWIERIPGEYDSGIKGKLADAGIRVPGDPSKIGEVKNLSSLIPIAQRTHRAVFELSGSEARGAQFTRARDTYESFIEIAEQIENRLDWLGDANDNT